MSEVIIRNFKHSDIRDLAEVVILAWKAAYRDILPDGLLDNLSMARAETKWSNLVKLDHVSTLIAEHTGRAIGFVRFGPSRDSDDDRRLVGEVYAIYVHPDSWRMGAGGALLQGAIDQLRRKRFAQLTLWTLQDNARARAFYQKQGLHLDGVSKKVRRGGEKAVEVRYRRAI